MKSLCIDLRRCYGIGSLSEVLNLDKRHVAIYASNGVMKSSLAQAFDDIGKRESNDRVFDKPDYRRTIRDDEGRDLDASSVLVIRPYRSGTDFARTSSGILASDELKSEYDRTTAQMQAGRSAILDHLKSASGMGDRTESAFLEDFGCKKDDAKELFGLLEKLATQDLGRFSELADVKYSIVKTTQVQKLLSDPDFKAHHDDYMSKYTQLVADSPYLTPDFDHTGAATACQQLEKSRFFEAKHQVRLVSSADHSATDLGSPAQFNDVIDREMERIDRASRPLWKRIDKEMSRNPQVRDFRSLASKNSRLRLELGDPAELGRSLWKAYLSPKAAEIADLADEYRTNQANLAGLEKRARAERTAWDEVVAKYNKRFRVPFGLSVTNRADALLGGSLPALRFMFTDHDGASTGIIEQGRLPDVLSEGENRALYMLNALFEIEAAVRSGRETTIIVDDIADSFDYKNKHAIVQYLKEISGHDSVHLVILTHNFDFFRTVCRRRIVKYSRCYYASKRAGDVRLVPARDILDPLRSFALRMDEPKKLIACIPFARNIIGYRQGTKSRDYAVLSSVLHYRKKTGRIRARRILKIMRRVFPKANPQPKPGLGKATMASLIEKEAKRALRAARSDPDRLDLADKLVLAVSIRVAAERFMVESLGGGASRKGYDTTYRLVKKYKKKFAGADGGALDILDRVVLVTPEVIHLNSFMYEPILDMSSDSLADLYEDVLGLKGGGGA